MKNQSFIDKCFRDSDNKITVFQKPNLSITVWAISLLVKQLTDGKIYELFDIIGFGALFTWAWLEIFQGVNYFRRVLGLIVLIFSIYNRLN